ncbi:unnamed protein product [Phytophthora fragariaefolia]|uniref:Unnamed protein product n=1 Tax=Phytophthora fragariaefolia TaxID=1490495 RepID=A0A9W7CXY8_9STRA|nr:unnamed protein product [Phytophthora fragariaefolia]
MKDWLVYPDAVALPRENKGLHTSTLERPHGDAAVHVSLESSQLSPMNELRPATLLDPEKEADKEVMMDEGYNTQQDPDDGEEDDKDEDQGEASDDGVLEHRALSSGLLI